MPHYGESGFGGGLYGDTSSFNTSNMYNAAQSQFVAPSHFPPVGVTPGLCPVADLSRTVTISAPITTQNTKTISWNTLSSQPMQVQVPHTVNQQDHGVVCVDQFNKPIPCRPPPSCPPPVHSHPHGHPHFGHPSW